MDYREYFLRCEKLFGELHGEFEKKLVNCVEENSFEIVCDIVDERRTPWTQELRSLAKVVDHLGKAMGKLDDLSAAQEKSQQKALPAVTNVSQD